MILAFVLASIGSHGNAQAFDAPPSFQAHAAEVAAAPHHAAPSTRHGAGAKHGTCCFVGQCVIGILWPSPAPLPQPEAPLLAGSPGRTLAGTNPETPYRPPA